MNVDRTTATLGWKESAERTKDPYHRLSSPEDFKAAFKAMTDLQNNSRRKKAVIMEELQPDGKTTKQAKKMPETAAPIPELAKVQAKLACTEHPGKNRWCSVMGATRKHPTKHVEFGIHVISLWARKIHDGEADEDCVTPPNILSVDALTERGRAREQRNTRGHQKSKTGDTTNKPAFCSQFK
ncbi:hypothetical protein B0H14DRAFT_2564786 [Mycena olivaceomarginata]|nr:hypothetical protein B0H14DRAFT_2564786 [Mycena olivaceomarginata]